MDYDGIVLESWSRWAAYGVLHDPDMRNKVRLIVTLSFVEMVSMLFFGTFFTQIWNFIVPFIYFIMNQ